MSQPLVDGFILAGGESRRMGKNKAFADVEGVPLIERVIAAVTPAVGRLSIIANDAHLYQHLGLPIIPDRWPGKAALGGIGTAVTEAATDRAFVAACDLPFLDPRLVELLLTIEPSADVVLPVAGGRHPLVAVYGKRCLPHIEERVAAGRLKVAGFFSRVTVREVTLEELEAAGLRREMLSNLNTPEELATARKPRA